MDKGCTKESFRKGCIERLRRSQKLSFSYKRDKVIEQAIWQIVQERGAKRILMFLPLKIEPDIFLLLLKLRKAGVEIYVPAVYGDTFRAAIFRFPLQKGRFGIKEVRKTQRKVPFLDMMLVPTVGFDETRRRIGFGKGMYDRFFAKHSDKIKEVVFVSRCACYSSKAITHSHDICADIIVTYETIAHTVWRFSKAHL